MLNFYSEKYFEGQNAIEIIFFRKIFGRVVGSCKRLILMKKLFLAKKKKKAKPQQNKQTKNPPKPNPCQKEFIAWGLADFSIR